MCSRPGGLADAWDAAWDRGAEGAEFAADNDVEALKASDARLAHKYLTEAVPAIEPVAVEVPVSGMTAGIAVRGIADIVTMDGTLIDIKTASRKPSGLAADHALQLATYAQLLRKRWQTPSRTDLSAGRRRHRWRFVFAEPRLERLQPAILRICGCL